MKFDMVTIKNFRNFENISVALTNKNVLFGMNDVGKTNFLYALRFVFDKDIRRQNFNDTDYYKKHIGSPIEIIVTIDISDQDDSDSQKLRAKLKGALLSGQNKVYIKVAASYDEKEMVGVPILYWGGDLNELEEMKVHGTFFEIDYVFNVIYIDAYVDLFFLVICHSLLNQTRLTRCLVYSIMLFWISMLRPLLAKITFSCEYKNGFATIYCINHTLACIRIM